MPVKYSRVFLAIHLVIEEKPLARQESQEHLYSGLDPPNIEYADPHILRSPAIAAYPTGT